jgi:2-octaprenylphenol hydroxylase
VVAITRASEQLLTQLEVWPFIQAQRICAYQRMTVWDSVADGHIQFFASDFFEPNLGYIIEQQVILGALHQAIAKTDILLLGEMGLSQIDQHEDFVTATLTNGKTIQSRLIIGADGANSIVRTLAMIPSKGWEYEQSAIVATIQGSQSHQATAFQRFAPDGPLALLPLASPDHCSIVWTTSVRRAKTLMSCSEDEFNQTLGLECNHMMGQMKLVGKRYSFDLKTHHAIEYAAHRCVLVGDAAHTLHPLAGQGVNLGFLDVAALVKVLNEVQKKNRDFGQLNYLQRYQRERRLHNQMMIWAMELFKRGFASQSAFVQGLRNIGLNWVDKHTMLKQLFAKMALGTLKPLPWMAN